MNTAFSHALRLVLCPRCAEALHASVAGGAVECDACDTAFEVGPRVEATETSQTDEDERLEELRRGDASPLSPPADVEALVERGELADDKAEEAMALWQQLRLEIEGEADVREAVGRRFYFLTRLIYERFVRQDDERRVRAVLETALEAVGHPRYRQTFRCMLASEAARVGDLAAAEDWLEPCDAKSTDIHADSVYRYTVAYLATHKRQWDRVVDTLGASHKDLPIARSFDGPCAVLRANAHERREDLSAAVYELGRAMQRVEGGRRAIDSIIRSHRSLGLCRRSYGRAVKRVAEGSIDEAGGALVAPLRVIPWVVLALISFGLAVGLGDGALTLRLVLVVAGIGLLVPPGLAIWRARGAAG